MNDYPFTVTDNSIVLAIGNRPMTVNKDDNRYEQVIAAVKDKDWDTILELLDLKGKLISESNGGLYLYNGMIRCDKYDVPALLAKRIARMFKDGFDIKPLSLFLENMMQNPNESGTIIEEIYGFIESGELPITADGCFLAYKMVSQDYKDLRTGRMDNSVGAVPEMERKDCDFDRAVTCSTGLHFCSEEYLRNGGYASSTYARVVMLKVNPRDITSIPTDYNNSKGRACKYEIVDDLEWDEIITPLFTSDYSGDVEVDEADEVDEAVDTNLRWEVRKTSTNELVKAFKHRQPARDCRNGFHPDQREYYIWDTDTREVSAGVRDYMIDARPDEGVDDEPAEVVKPNPSAKLDDATVKEIRQIIADGAYDTFASLAAMYGVSDRTIRRIRKGESWTHVTL